MTDWDKAQSATSDSSAGARRASVGELVGQVSDQFARLMRAEVNSYKTELKQKATKSGLGIGLLVAAGVLALYLVGVLIAAVVAAFATIMPVWGAALIVAAILIVIIAVLGLVGVKALKNNVPPMPQQAVSRIKQDLNTVKEDIK